MIIRHVFLLAVGIGVVGPILADAPKELPKGAKQALQALRGKWRVVKLLHADRETTPGRGDVERVIEFKGRTIDFAGSAAGVVVALDPTTDPKCLDFKARVGSGVFKKGSTYGSVYKLDGRTLTWAVYVGRGKNRPVAFDKPKVAGVMVMVLDRVKN
jgi:uncharacterized protein (TIGR03067 family)